MRKLVHLIQKARYFDIYGHVIVYWQNEKKKGDRAKEKGREGAREKSIGDERGITRRRITIEAQKSWPPQIKRKKYHPSFFSIGTHAVVLTNLELISFLSLRPVLTVSWRRISRLSLIRRLHSRFPFFLS